jgi:transposase
MINQTKNLPTPAQEAWLNENYKLYTRYHIAEKLEVTQYTLKEWLKQLGLKKRDAKAIMFTDEQKKFIKDKYEDLSHEQIAATLCLSVSSVSGYCFRNGYKKSGQNKVTPPPKKIIPYRPEPAIKRPPATYSNVSRDQHIDRWLNVQI